MTLPRRWAGTALEPAIFNIADAHARWAALWFLELRPAASSRDKGHVWSRPLGGGAAQ
jgi:hypothetical protein